jgi:hypothetical protein
VRGDGTRLPLTNAPTPTYLTSTRDEGAVAQLGERRVRNAEVRGSIPLGSAKVKTLRTAPLLSTGSCTATSSQGARTSIRLPCSALTANGQTVADFENRKQRQDHGRCVRERRRAAVEVGSETTLDVLIHRERPLKLVPKLGRVRRRWTGLASAPDASASVRKMPRRQSVRQGGDVTESPHSPR